MNFSDKTVGGFPVRILCTDAAGPYPVVGLVDYGPQGTSVFRWTSLGRCNLIHRACDLVPEPRRATRDVLCTLEPGSVSDYTVKFTPCDERARKAAKTWPGVLGAKIITVTVSEGDTYE